MGQWKARPPEATNSTADMPKFLEPSTHPAALSPFSVASDGGAAPSQSALDLGRAFSNFYGAFWSDSRFPSPRCLLLNSEGTVAVLVPHALTSSSPNQPIEPALRRMLDIIHAQAAGARTGSSGMGWYRRDLSDGSRWLLSVMRAPQDAAIWKEGMGVPAISCMLDVARIDDHRQVLGEPVYDRLSILAPGGQLLYGPDVPDLGGQSKHYTARSVTYRMRDAEGWQAVYQIDWSRLLVHQRGPLLGSVIAALLLALGGIVALRSYRSSVLVPLRSNQERLLESEAFSRTVLEAAPIGLCLLRTADGTVVLENALARSWLGEQNDAPGWDGTWRTEVLAQSPHGRTLPYETPEGRHLLVNATPTRYRGEPVTLCLFIDLTTQHQAEQVLLQARHDADEANRAKSFFLATMSHEIRTPLYGVLGTLELMGLTPLDSRQKDYLETIQQSSSVLMHLISDILDVSKAEAGQLVLEPLLFSPAELTEDVLRSYAASAARKGLQLYACIDGDLPDQVRGDATRLRQVLNNLVSNAIKFTEAGRVVVRLQQQAMTGVPPQLSWQVADTGIGIEERHQKHLFEAFYQANPGADAQRGTGLGLAISAQLVTLMGGQLRLVSDIGLGSSFSFQLPLPPSDARPAVVTKNGSQQLIYVRSPARELVDSLCARLGRRGFVAQPLPRAAPLEAVQETPLLDIPLDAALAEWQGPHVVARGGSAERPQKVDGRWQVSVHRLDAIVEALLLASGYATSPPTESGVVGFGRLGLDVLVAEDNPINQMILREQLEQLGCCPVVASDGDEALGYSVCRRFDVVLTDLNMPHMDGFALAQRLREAGATMPIFGATANADPAERERCRKVGMQGCLVKPIRLEDLHRCLALVPASEGVAQDVLSVSTRMQPIFLDTMRSDMADLRHAVAIGDALLLKEKLHRLRGALVMVSGEVLVEEATRIEAKIDTGASAQECGEDTHAFLARLDRALSQLSSGSDGTRGPL